MLPFLFLSLSALLFAVAVARAEPSVPAYELSIVSPMVKVRGDESGPVNPGRTLELNAARGEGESGQILIQASRDLHAVAVSLTRLEGPDGAVVPVEVHRVGYVKVTHPSPGGFGRPGPYPDPLLPLQPFEVAAGGSQAIWLTAWVPREVKTGDYQGMLTVSPANAEARSLAVRVRVSSVTLPVRSALRTSFLIWGYGENAQWYGKQDWAVRKKQFAETMLRYRLTALTELPWGSVFTRGGDGVWTASWTEFDAAVERALAMGTTFFEVRYQFFPWYGGKPLAEFPDQEIVAAKLRLLDAHLRARGWSDRFGFYLYDEPLISDDYPKKGDGRGSENARNIRGLATFIHANAPSLRQFMVTCDPAYGNVAMDFPAFIWCPHINHFNPAFQARRKALGEPNWMYVCVTTVNAPAFPDFWRIDRTGASHRAIGSWLRRYDCDGTLYWCVNYWPKNPHETPDIFPMAGSNGDGFLFYPDPGKRQGPFPSVRVELLRDGIEDCDLMAELDAAVAARRGREPRPADEALLAEVAALLDLTSVIPAVSLFATDPHVYETRHRRLLDALERMQDP